MLNLKELFIMHVITTALEAKSTDIPLRILDVGCGTASYVPHLIKQFPNVTYVGIEPIKQSYDAALTYTQGIEQASVHFGLAYDAVTEYEDESFDLIMSLSVLEHVKRLPEFLQFCARYLAPGGQMVHRYDLGHALYPHNCKAWLHVQLGNYVPGILPETQFVRYVPQTEVEAVFASVGVPATHATYHQLPNAKMLEKALRDQDVSTITDLFAWELSHQSVFATLPTSERERLFPSVAVWGTKPAS